MVRLTLLIVVFAICVSASNGARLRPDEIEQGVGSKNHGSFCQGCRSIVSFASRFNSSTRRLENRELLSKFCETYYPTNTEFRLGSCPLVVEGIFHVLERIDPVNQCDEMGACGTNHPISQNTLAVQDISGGADGAVCNFCTDVVQRVKVQLEDPRLIDDIHRKVGAFCDYLTVIDADKQCRAALLGYIDQAIEFIKKIKPADLCRSLHFCSAVVRTPAMLSKSEPQKTMPTLADFNDFGLETSVQVGGQLVKSVGIKSPNCLFCKTLVKEMFKFLKDNKTDENINAILDHGCELIYTDKAKRDRCEDLVRAYSKELIELLADETNPEVICMLLEQCTFQTMLPSLTPKTIPKQGMARPSTSSTGKPITMSQFISMLDPTIDVNSMRTCIECKLFFKYLQETIEKQASQEEIKDWLLKNLCSNLGDGGLSESCTNLINQESSVFFQAVVESLNPKKSCVQLGACSALIRDNYVTQLQKQLANLLEFRPISIPTKPLCEKCVQIVTKIDDYLSTHPVDHDIAVLKEKVCNTIQDDNLRGECIMIIQTFGQEIIQAISNMDSPRQLCDKISLC